MPLSEYSCALISLLCGFVRLRWYVNIRGLPANVEKQMRRMRFITSKIHGILDYILGSILVLSPLMFGLSGTEGAA